MEEAMAPLKEDGSFLFSCTEKVACFNDCCRDLNQLLSPYDILRLKNRLAVSSSQFLSQFTCEQIGPETGLPVITLRALPETGLKCPFVRPAGCLVYEDRPASCRMYPLARILSRCRETGKTREQYLLITESHCRGFFTTRQQTVKEWLAGQQLEVYNEMNDLLMEIISLKNRLQPEPLDLEQRLLFRMALYDLDEFRRYLTKEESPVIPSIQTTLPGMLTDDAALLRFGFEWIKAVLFK